MSKLQRRLFRWSGILVLVAGLGLGTHFLIRALIDMHS